jgi:hypothetical protein
MIAGLRDRKLNWRPTRAALTSAVTGLAILASGCGSSHTPGVAAIGSKTTTDANTGIATVPTLSDEKEALRCMRTHGVPNMPDLIDGRLGFSIDSGINPDSPKFEAAYKLCGDRYLGLSHRSTPAQRALWNEQAEKYSVCMRSHGASNFPDPEQGNGLIDVPTSTYLDTPLVVRAQLACKPLFTGKFAFVVPFR